MKTGYTIADCMTTKPITCGKDLSIRECAQLMKQHDVGSVLVFDGDKLIGLVTEDDFVQKAVAEGLSHEENIMVIITRDLITIHPSKDILEASKIMNKNNIHHLPVMEGEKMVGFITLRTILKIEPELVELLAERTELRGISPGSPLISSFEQELSEGQCESCNNYSSQLTADSAGKMLCPNCLVI